MSSSSPPPDPWREPVDPDAAPTWGRPPRQPGGPPGSDPRAPDPGMPDRTPHTPSGRNWWAPKESQAQWDPRSSEWEAQPVWGQPPSPGHSRPPSSPQPGMGGPGAPGGPGGPGMPGMGGPGAGGVGPRGQQDPYQDVPYGSTGQQAPYQTGQYPPQTGQYPPQTGQYPPQTGQYPGEAVPGDPYAIWGAEQPWEEDGTVLEAEPRARRKWPLLVLGLVGVVIVGFVLFPAIRNLLGGSDGAEGAQVVALNEPGTDGSVEFTTAAVDCTDTTLGDTGIVAEGVFCVLHLRVTNAGEAPLLLDPTAQQVFDANDQPLTVNEQWLALGERSFLGEIAPGQTVSGVVVYDAQTGTQPSRVELHASAEGSGVTVDLTAG